MGLRHLLFLSCIVGTMSGTEASTRNYCVMCHSMDRDHKWNSCWAGKGETNACFTPCYVGLYYHHMNGTGVYSIQRNCGERPRGSDYKGDKLFEPYCWRIKHTNKKECHHFCKGAMCNKMIADYLPRNPRLLEKPKRIDPDASSPAILASTRLLWANVVGAVVLYLLKTT